MQSQEGYMLTQGTVHTGLATQVELTSPVCTEVAKGKPGLTLIININADLQLDTSTLKSSNSLLTEVHAYS